ncbi:hypothetical protein [Streptomyces carpaticus]|uniref:hypothetical protein n=1 Tax=Streptomyces carpaticus TaxID=285558 RepID=UPI0031F7E8F5
MKQPTVLTPGTEAVIDAWMTTLCANQVLFRADRLGAGAWSIQRTPESDPEILADGNEAARFIRRIQRTRHRTTGEKR